MKDINKAEISVKTKDNCIHIECKNDLLLEEKSIKEHIRNYIKKRINNDKVYKILKPKVDYYSRKFNLRYSKLKIINKGPMGNCSAESVISLNVSMLFCSEEYQESVIIHELTDLPQIKWTVS